MRRARRVSGGSGVGERSRSVGAPRPSDEIFAASGPEPSPVAMWAALAIRTTGLVGPPDAAAKKVFLVVRYSLCRQVDAVFGGFLTCILYAG